MHTSSQYLFLRLFLFCILTLIITPHAFAADIFTTETIPAENRSPIIQLFALSRPDYTQQTKQNTNTWKSRIELVNYLSKTKKNDEYLFIDGETWQLSNELQHQLTNNIILHLNIPWIWHSDGIADHFIYAFHELFQLPQNGRTDTNHDLIFWDLRYNNQSIVSLNENKSGIGDISVKLSWSPSNYQNTQLTGQIKLPTGNFDDQTGSGKLDAGFSVLQKNPDWLKNRHWLSAFKLSIWYGAGINYIGSVNALEDFEQNPFAATLRAGLAWAISSRWVVKTQFDSNSPLFNSNIRELGWMPVQISFSSEHKLSDSTTLDFMMSEDLRPRASPDIAFSTGLSIQF